MGILSIAIQGILILMFLMAGIGKLSGGKVYQNTFTHLRLPQWFRVVTGIIELVAALLLIAGFWKEDYAIFGALVIVITAIGGAFSHIRVKDGLKETFMIVLLGIIAAIFVWIK